MEALLKRLKAHEGVSLEVYPDRDGYAIGYGHQCAPDHPPISLHEAEEYLRQDVYKASEQYMKWKAAHKLKLSRVRDEVIVEMIFWHGYWGFLKFQRMIEALIQGDYEKAADEMMNSDSGQRYPARMYELSVLMREG